jgi:hypothetical protein
MRPPVPAGGFLAIFSLLSELSGQALLTGEKSLWPAYLYQRLRSASSPLQSRECQGTSLDTELSLKLVDAEVPIMSFPLQHAKGDEAAGHVMLLSPVRARLTAGQAQLILAHPDDLLNLGTHVIQAAHLCGRQRQAIGGIVLLAVSDNEPFEASVPPAAFGPIGVPPMVPQGVPIEPAILFETADELPPIVANPLEEGSRGYHASKSTTSGWQRRRLRA